MRIIVLLAAAAMLVGCTSFSQVNDPERFEQVTGVDKHSSYPAVRRASFENVNLLELVDPEKRAEKEFSQAWKDTELHRTVEDRFGARYDLVLSWFRQRTDISPEEKRRRRNGIQERILSVSISRCNVFKTFLRRDQANQNFLLGALTTASGVLGAILGGVNSSRNLAGAAGLFSGIRSEYNQAYYSNLAAHVIVKGIETRQELIYRRIQTEGQRKSIDDYPLEAAIKDAIFMDGLCSVVAGLDQAAASVDATIEPGLDAATRTMLRARLAREALDMPRDELLKPETLDRIGLAGQRLGMSLVGSALGEAVPVEAEVDLFVAATKMAEQAKAAGDAVASSIDQTATARRSALIDELKKKDPVTAKKYEDAAKTIDVAKEVKALLKAKVFDPLKLESCYTKIAGPAVEERLKAVRKRDAATKDEDKIKAEHEVRNAARLVQSAHDQLRRKEQLVNVELNTYESRRIAEIKAIIDPKDAKELIDPKKVADNITPTATKSEGCG